VTFMKKMNLATLLKNEKKFLFFLFILSLFIRILFFQIFEKNNPYQLIFDSGHYHNVAVNISQGKGISNNDGSPHFYRLPGYPLFFGWML